MTIAAGRVRAKAKTDADRKQAEDLQRQAKRRLTLLVKQTKAILKKLKLDKKKLAFLAGGTLVGATAYGMIRMLSDHKGVQRKPAPKSEAAALEHKQQKVRRATRG